MYIKKLKNNSISPKRKSNYTYSKTYHVIFEPSIALLDGFALNHNLQGKTTLPGIFATSCPNHYCCSVLTTPLERKHKMFLNFDFTKFLFETKKFTAKLCNFTKFLLQQLQ